MEYSSGMGIEMPKWVITTQSNKKFFNSNQNRFVEELEEQCTFATPDEANDVLKQLDFGYVIKPARMYMDVENTHIRMA